MAPVGLLRLMPQLVEWLGDGGLLSVRPRGGLLPRPRGGLEPPGRPEAGAGRRGLRERRPASARDETLRAAAGWSSSGCLRDLAGGDGDQRALVRSRSGLRDEPRLTPREGGLLLLLSSRAGLGSGRFRLLLASPRSAVLPSPSLLAPASAVDAASRGVGGPLAASSAAVGDAACLTVADAPGLVDRGELVSLPASRAGGDLAEPVVPRAGLAADLLWLAAALDGERTGLASRERRGLAGLDRGASEASGLLEDCGAGDGDAGLTGGWGEGGASAAAVAGGTPARGGSWGWSCLVRSSARDGGRLEAAEGLRSAAPAPFFSALDGEGLPVAPWLALASSLLLLAVAGGECLLRSPSLRGGLALRASRSLLLDLSRLPRLRSLLLSLRPPGRTGDAPRRGPSRSSLRRAASLSLDRERPLLSRDRLRPLRAGDRARPPLSSRLLAASLLRASSCSSLLFRSSSSCCSSMRICGRRGCGGAAGWSSATSSSSSSKKSNISSSSELPPRLRNPSSLAATDGLLCSRAREAEGERDLERPRSGDASSCAGTH